MLNLPIDIIALVFTYTRMQKLASWVELDSAGYDIDLIMSNKNSIDWAIENKEWLFPRCCIRKDNGEHGDKSGMPKLITLIGCFSHLFENKSEKIDKLYEEVKKYIGYDYEFTFNDLYSVQPYLSGFIFHRIKNKDEICKYIHDEGFRRDLINAGFIIPELINWYENNSRNISHDELKSVAYGCTWELFVKLVENSKYTIDKFSYEISYNSSKGAIEYMGKNIDIYKNIIRDNIYLDPNISHIINIIPYSIIEEHKNSLCANPAPEIIAMIRADNELISEGLSSNPSDAAIDILYANLDKLDYNLLASNTNPRIIWLLKRYYRKFKTSILLQNPLIFPLFRFNSSNTNRVIQLLDEITKQKLTKLIEHEALMKEFVYKNKIAN